MQQLIIQATANWGSLISDTLLICRHRPTCMKQVSPSNRRKLKNQVESCILSISFHCPHGPCSYIFMHFGEQRKQQHVPLERPRSTNFQCLGGRALLPSWGDTSSASNLSTWGSAQMMAPHGPYQTRSWILFELVNSFNWYTVARVSMKFQLHETGNPIWNGSVTLLSSCNKHRRDPVGGGQQK